MDAIKAYILSVTTSAVLCGCLMSLVDKNGNVSKTIRVLCAVFISISVIRPFVDLKLPDLSELVYIDYRQVMSIVDEGEQKAVESQVSIIKERVEEYIIEKASELSCSVNVEVRLSKDAPYVPCGVVIRGAVSPYVKTKMEEWIENNFSIPREAQKWYG